MNSKISISKSELYLRELERIAEEINYLRYEFENRLSHFKQEDNPKTKIDLLSSIAYVEKYILPFTAIQQFDVQLEYEGSQILAFGLDGNWGAYEFRHLFEGIDFLNKLLTIRDKLERDSPDFRLQQGYTRAPVYRKALLQYYLSTSEELRVRRVEFGSPGLVNFEGLGEVIKEIRKSFDYLITGVIAKRAVNNFRQIRDRELRQKESEARRAEAEARRAEAEARKFEAGARRDEALLRQIETRSRIKKAIREIQEYDGKHNIEHSEKEKLALTELNKLADIAVKIEFNGLAYLPVVEEQIIHATSVLNRLSHEEHKVKLISPEQEKP